MELNRAVAIAEAGDVEAALALVERLELDRADALEAEVKRTMIAQAGEATLLVDQTKMRVRGLSVIASVAEVSNVIAHGLSGEEISALRAARGSVRVLDGRDETARHRGAIRG